MPELKVNVKATTKAGDKLELKVPYTIPDTVAENVEVHGEKAVLYNLTARIKLAIQAKVRSYVETSDDPVTDESIRKVLDDFKVPDGSRAKKSETEKALALAKKLSPEDLEALKALLNQVEEEV